MKKTLHDIYYTPAHPASFSSVKKLYTSAKNVEKDISEGDVKEWLGSQDAYTLHRPVRKRFPRNQYHVTNINDLFQADLIDMRSLSKYNDRVKYVLTVIDVFSKFAWARKLNSKHATTVAAAFEDIFTADKRIPVNVQTDKGKEFIGKPVQKLFKKYNINFYVARNPDTKAAVVERFNRTLKTKMFKYFTYANSYRYIDVLQDLLTSYNNTVHRTIKMTPAQVNDSNILTVYNNTYAQSAEQSRQDAKYEVGDHVRISKYKHVLEKSYTSNWSDEVFRITRVIRRKPVVYEICDLLGEDIDGVFYENELQRISLPADTKYKVDKILRKRTHRGRSEVFVKWRGYPSKFNTWIRSSELTAI